VDRIGELSLSTRFDFREGDELDEEALKALIRAAVALNTSSARG
jgi:hypothetical protein